jgi:hypothetical protein
MQTLISQPFDSQGSCPAQKWEHENFSINRLPLCFGAENEVTPKSAGGQGTDDFPRTHKLS